MEMEETSKNRPDSRVWLEMVKHQKQMIEKTRLKEADAVALIEKIPEQ